MKGMAPPLQWLNDNWFQVVGPILIIVLAWVGGVWLRRLVFDALSRTGWRARWRPFGLILNLYWQSFLEWAVILGFFIAVNVSVLPSEAVSMLNRALVSFLVLCVARLVMGVGEGLFLFYEVEFRRSLHEVKAPQPPRALVISSIRVGVVLATAVSLLRVWQGPEISGLLILVAFAIVGLLALRDATESLRWHPLASVISPLRNRRIQKTAVSIVAMVLLLDLFRRLAQVSSMEEVQRNAQMLWIVLEISGLIWAGSVLRRSQFKRTRPRFAAVAVSVVVLLAVPILLGVEPIAGYAEMVYGQTQATLGRIQPHIELSPSTPSGNQAALNGVKTAVVRVEASTSAGTGMVLDAEGTVLTCFHVVKDSHLVRVVLSSGRYYECSVAATDPATELAMLVPTRLVSTPSYVRFGALADIKSGDDVWVVGYALGLAGDATVTRGIVSAIRQEAGVDYLQTDATMNSGNSGGPIVDQRGNVVAVAAFKLADKDLFIEGMQFGVAIHHAEQLLRRTATSAGTSNTPDIGVRVMELANAERARRGTGTLQWSDELAEISRTHATQMAASGTMFHSSMNEAHAENCWMGAAGYFGASDIVTSWMNSEFHRTWLLCPSLRNVGVGIASNGEDMFAAWTFWRHETATQDWWYTTGAPKPQWWY
jgi:S1-C subfamily serine protease